MEKTLINNKVNTYYDLGVVFFIVVLAIKLFWGVTNAVDIAWDDETQYLAQGVSLCQKGLPSPQWAPLYAIWYQLISWFVEDNFFLYYANYLILGSLTPVIFYIFQRHVGFGRIWAFIFSCIYLTSYSNLVAWPYPTKFALLIFLFFLLVYLKLQVRDTKYCVLSLGLLLITFVRPEYFLSFILVLLWWIIKSDRKKSFRQTFTIVLVASLLSFTIFGNPLRGSRSADAFRQHFAINYIMWC